MKNIWNPWHGCKKKSEGCENCYMYYLDRQRDRDGGDIYKVKGDFDLPMKRDRDGFLQNKIREPNSCLRNIGFFPRRGG